MSSDRRRKGLNSRRGRKKSNGKGDFVSRRFCGIILPAMKNHSQDFPDALDVLVFARARRDWIGFLFALVGLELRKKYFRLNVPVRIGGIDVAAGWVWDWVSARFFAKMLGFGSLMHDWRYRHCLGKLRADWLMLLDCLRWDRANPLVAFLAFLLLVFAGWPAYWRHWLRLRYGWFSADAQMWVDPLMTNLDARRAHALAMAAGMELPTHYGGQQIQDLAVLTDPISEILRILGKVPNSATGKWRVLVYEEDNWVERECPGAPKMRGMDFDKWRGALKGMR